MTERTKVSVVQTDTGIYWEDGTEVKCQWFLECPSHATTTQHHPILGDVPVCSNCKAWCERMRGVDDHIEGLGA